jgi:hypothetical protein
MFISGVPRIGTPESLINDLNYTFSGLQASFKS